MRRLLLCCLTLMLALSSCTSLRYAGVNRVRNYNISSSDIPESFDEYRIAFASDFHLKSKFKERQLHGTVKALQAAAPDMLLLGGDYQEGCEYVEPLFSELSRIATPDGIYAVLGNNDYERCTDLSAPRCKSKASIYWKMPQPLYIEATTASYYGVLMPMLVSTLQPI